MPDYLWTKLNFFVLVARQRDCAIETLWFLCFYRQECEKSSKIDLKVEKPAYLSFSGYSSIKM